MNAVRMFFVALFALALAFTATANPISFEAPANLYKSHPLCGICVQLTSQTMNQLVNIIMQVGVLGTCGKICGLLPAALEAEACQLICSIAGVKEFVKVLSAVDPDPIAICVDLKVCPYVAGGKASFTQMLAQPASIPQGGAVTVDMHLVVSSPTSTGELAFEIITPDQQAVGDSQVNEGLAVGAYNVPVKVDTTPSEQMPWNAGEYKFIGALCCGTCGSKHKNSVMYASNSTSFAVTQN